MQHKFSQSSFPSPFPRSAAFLAALPAWSWLLILFVVSAGLRFWRVDQFNVLVFDEVHFAKFANDYLTHTRFFENHPPLGKYFIAAGIWLSSFYPFTVTNNLLGTPLSPFEYRWMNALMGSFIPLVTAGLAWQITGQRRTAFIAGLFAGLEGMALVESRYALVNIYIVLFGLLGQYLFLIALQKAGTKKYIWFFLAALCFGSSFAVKWNGLGFLLGILGIFSIIKIVQLKRNIPEFRNTPPALSPSAWGKTGIPIIIGVVIVAVAFYSLIWIPHLMLNDNMGFWGWHKYLVDSQSSVGENIHPYCSRWYTWPLLERPVAYYFQAEGPPDHQIFYDVHAMGNPALWWLSGIAMFLLIGFVVQRGVLLTSSFVTRDDKKTLVQSGSFWVAFYLVINYAANWAPWVGISRCTFLYHYMPASYFALLGLAWLVSRGTSSPRLSVQIVAWICVALVIASFLYFLPLYLGLPLPSKAFYHRMWFRSWI